MVQLNLYPKYLPPKSDIMRNQYSGFFFHQGTLRSIFLAAFCMLSLFVYAQTGGKEDVVYVKNGWVIRGKILELDTQGSVKIQTVGGNIFTFKMEEVDRITQEAAIGPVHSKTKPGLFQKKKFSYFNGTEMGLLVGSQPFFTFKITNGIYISERLRAGIGVAYQKLTWDMQFAPVFLQVRSELLKKRPVTPMGYIAGGYNFSFQNKDPWVGKVRGGIMADCGLGLKFNTSYEMGYTFLLNYQYSRAHQTQDFGNGFIRTQEIQFNRIGLMLGITF